MKMVAQLALALAISLAMSCDNDDGSAKCEEVKSLLADCYDTRCAASDDANESSFCQCWGQGLDLNVLTCTCVERQEDAVCEVYNLDSFSVPGFSCTNAMDYLAGQCTDSTPVVEADATTTEDAETSATVDVEEGDSGPTG